MSDDYDIFWFANGNGILIVLFIILFPIVPAGDIGIAFAASFGENTTVIAYILSWLFFAGSYGAFLLYVVGGILLKDYGTFVRVVVYYVQGIYLTYFVAALENATSEKNISDLQTILADLMQNAKINESSRLAAHVQSELFQHLEKSYDKIKSKGVKQAPFYVLLGAQMPAILIETSFISNPRECKRLTNSHYQDKLCEGIVKGIREYIKEINPTALLKITPHAKVKVKGS